MRPPRSSAGSTPRHGDARSDATIALGLGAALMLVTLAAVIPAVTGWDVAVGVPPLFGRWGPRVGPGTFVAVPLAVLGVYYGGRVSRTTTWSHLLIVCWLVGVGWLAALALVDVRAGLVTYSDIDDFLKTARTTTDVEAMLHGFVSRIGFGPAQWPTHVAGHPAGALLFFVLLVHIRLGANVATGVVVTLAAATIPLAALCTLRELGAERSARQAAPFLVLAPAAVWAAVSFDAVISCLIAWTLAALARGAVRRSPSWSLLGGLLFGACLLTSYGAPVLGILVLGVLLAAGSWRPLAYAAPAAAALVAACWLAGFALWDAYPALHARYWGGIAHLRPASYWLWGDLAALCISAGPVVGAGVACLLTSRCAAAERRVVCLLGSAAVLCVLAADVSLMSKAEVERIWLPFVPWLLVLSALLPPRWVRPALALQVAVALLVQHLVVTGS